MLYTAPHLIRYVNFVLQLQPSPWCETLNYTLRLPRRQPLQDRQDLLSLRAAYETSSQLHWQMYTDVKKTSRFNSWVCFSSPCLGLSTGWDTDNLSALSAVCTLLLTPGSPPKTLVSPASGCIESVTVENKLTHGCLSAGSQQRTYVSQQ